MAVTKQTMTDEQRKSVALEYLKAFDAGGTTSTGGSILDLFADDAQVYFPKWGLAEGKDQIGRMFGDVGARYKAIKHNYADFNWIMTGSDLFACEGTSYGEHVDGEWRGRRAPAAPGRGGGAGGGAFVPRRGRCLASPHPAPPAPRRPPPSPPRPRH